MDTLDDQNFPDPSGISPRDTGLRWGVILALVGIIFQGLIYVIGGGDPTSGGASGLGCLSGIASIAIIVMGIKAHRDKDLGGFISLGRGLTVSFWIGLASGIISSIWNYLFVNFIAPETMDAAKEQLDQIRAQVEDGEAPEMLLTFTESAMNMGSNPIFGVIASIIFAIIIGFFASLFLKRDRPMA